MNGRMKWAAGFNYGIAAELRTRILNLPANAKKRAASASVFSGRHISQKIVLRGS